MTKNIIIVSGIILSFFLALGYVFCAEEITITTYYPSPYGSYNKLTTNTLGIGDVDDDGGLDDGDAPDPSTNTGDLWLDGKIDMGKNDPYALIIGNLAGSVNTGQYNTFIGKSAGRYNTTGNRNTFLGVEAGYSNSTGANNVFIGGESGVFNTTGSYNTFVGYNSGDSSTSGSSNAFFGGDAGYSNTTGYQNTFLGRETGYPNTTGFLNTFVGQRAGYSNTTGFVNTYLGAQAGYANTTGGFNTFVGSGAGDGNVTGSNNVFIGYKAGAQEAGSNKLYIDNSNTALPLIYGDFSADTITINGQLSASTCGGCVSDRKFKKDINTIESPIEKILKMRGVSFNWNEKYKGRGFPEGRHFGLIAQEVKEVLPEVVSYNSYKENTIVYTEIIPVLIEAIKEQQREIEILKKKIERKKL